MSRMVYHVTFRKQLHVLVLLAALNIWFVNSFLISKASFQSIGTYSSSTPTLLRETAEENTGAFVDSNESKTDRERLKKMLLLSLL